jgi:hypothetical protein
MGVIGGKLGRVPNHGPAIRVTGIIGHGITRLFSVEPVTGPTIKPVGASPVTIDVANASGHTVSSTEVPVTIGHMDEIEPFMVVDAVVKSPDAASVSLMYQGHRIAKLSRPPHTPVVKLLTPRRGARISGRGTTLVRWKVRDPDHVRLSASIDYAANGHTFRVVLVGLHGSSARLPGNVLTHSKRGRIRIRVSDGWNVGTAVSGPLKVAGPAAKAMIEEPLGGARVAADATFVARASAFDDRNRAIGGRSMRWFDGSRYLGSGAELTIHGMIPGRRQLRLVTIADGRRAVFSVPVTVVSDGPMLTLLKAPTRISRRARRLALTVASAVPATLVINGRAVRVGPAARSIRVRVQHFRRRVRLAFELRAFTGTMRFVRYVMRR